MKFETVVLCLKLLACLIVQRSFGYRKKQCTLLHFIIDIKQSNRKSLVTVKMSPTILRKICSDQFTKSSKVGLL